MKLTTMGPRLPCEQGLISLSHSMKLISPEAWLRGVAVWVLSFFYKDQIAATMLAANRPKSVSEYWQFNARRDAFADEVRKSVSNRRVFVPPSLLLAENETSTRPGSRAHLTPSSAQFRQLQLFPTMPLARSRPYVSAQCSGTSLIRPVSVLSRRPTAPLSLIHRAYPVGVLPVTHVDPKRDALTPEWRVGNPSSCNAPSLERAIYDGGGPFASPSHRGGKVYDEQEMAGLPVGVQVVLPRWQEEKCLACMRVVEGALGKRREEKEGAQL